MHAGEDDPVTSGSMSAEVNDVWAVSEEQSLQVARPRRRINQKLKALAAWTFLKPLENFSGFFVDQNPAGVPGIRG